VPRLAISVDLPDPEPVVAPRLVTVLCEYAERPDLVLSVALGVAGSALGVPVRLEALRRPRDPDAIAIVMSARHRTDWFPSFRGDVRVEPRGPLASRLRLDGDYAVPLGAVGLIVNRRVLNGAAERSLREFLARLKHDVVEEIRRSELAIRTNEGSRA
jgi:hypothetical protein